MVCQILYQSEYLKNCTGIGESCEICKPIFNHPTLILLGIGVFCVITLSLLMIYFKPWKQIKY